MTTYNFSWTTPVELELPSGLTRRFQNAYDALDFLDAEWPTRRGPAYAKAVSLCRTALHGPRATDPARTAFIAAAAEAGMREAADPSRLVSFLPQGRAAVA